MKKVGKKNSLPIVIVVRLEKSLGDGGNLLW